MFAYITKNFIKFAGRSLPISEVVPRPFKHFENLADRIRFNGGTGTSKKICRNCPCSKINGDHEIVSVTFLRKIYVRGAENFSTVKCETVIIDRQCLATEAAAVPQPLALVFLSLFSFSGWRFSLNSNFSSAIAPNFMSKNDLWEKNLSSHTRYK